MILLVICSLAAAYQVVAITACLRQLFRPKPRPAADLPPVSVLKPIYGLDDHFYRAIVSQASQDYPQYEIIFGHSNPDEPALRVMQRLQAEFPNLPIRIVPSRTKAANGKVGVLQDLAREARYPIWVVNDSDIFVEPDYLRTLASELQTAGLVTCLYRATADTFPSRLEALGIATDFAPSTLVAPLVGIDEFGLGSTLAFRSADWNSAGGFESVADYIADDFQLGKQLSEAGKRVRLSTMVVETHLGAASWREVWEHQVRWACTIRVSQGAGYTGLPVTFASLWALVALAFGHVGLAFVLFALRMIMAAMGCIVLRDWKAASMLWLVPLRDLFGSAVWTAGLIGNEVTWRDRSLRLTPDGRIVP